MVYQQSSSPSKQAKAICCCINLAEPAACDALQAQRSNKNKNNANASSALIATVSKS
jgi:hypothetical protein